MKTLFKVFAAICLVIVIATIAVVVMVDPNDYRTQVQDQVKQKINRDLELKGDISWSIFPTLGFETTDLYIKNPEGFNRENLLEIKHTSVAVELMPLLSGKVNIGKVTLDGFRFNVITKANGESNLDGMSDKEEHQHSPDEESSDNGVSGIESLKLGGVAITNAVFEIQDLKLKSTTLATIKHITLGQFELGKETSLSMAIEVVLGESLKGEVNLESRLLVSEDLKLIDLSEFTLNSELTGQSLPAGSIKTLFESNISYNRNTSLAKISDIEFSMGELTLSGWASVQSQSQAKVRFKLAGNVWDLNPYMPESSASEPTTETAPAGEPDLSVLKTLDINGDFSLAGLKAAGLTLGKINTKIIVANGKAKLAPMTAALYDGSIVINATVEHANGKNRYRVTKKITGVQIQPLMKDLADIDLISGRTNMTVNAKGQGLAVAKIKAGVLANGDFEITDGSLYGINIPQKIRSAKATLTGTTAASGDSSEKTDFTSLVGKFSMAKGIFDNTSLTMASPLIRLNGAGTANVLDETVDYKLGVTLVGSLEGQGADSELSGLKIPLKVSGSFSDPKFGLDTSGALKAKLDQEKQKLKDQVKDKLKDKLKSKLGGLFGD